MVLTLANSRLVRKPAIAGLRGSLPEPRGCTPACGQAPVLRLPFAADSLAIQRLRARFDTHISHRGENRYHPTDR